MRLKHSIILFFIALLPLKIFAQVNISGQVKDSANKPLEFIEILIQDKDSVLRKSELTDANGKFSIIIQKGTYILLAKKMGIILYKQKLDAQQTIDLGVILIDEHKKILTEVTVTSKKKLIERRADRLIFNVENSMAATGGDALDALRLTPGIRVQDDEISMIGKNGVGLMIDGRITILSGEQLISFLKTIKSDDLKSIEVITNPPAKYDAQGSGGLINIKFKKIKLDSWNASINGSYRQATHPSANVGESFNFQKNRFSFYNNISYSDGSVRRYEQDEIYYNRQTWITGFNKRNYSTFISNRAGLDYKMTKKWATGVLYLGSTHNTRTRENDFGIITNNTSKEVDSLINTSAVNRGTNKSHSINWHNNVDLGSNGLKMTTDFDFFTINNETSRDFETQNLFANATQTPSGYLSVYSPGKQIIKNYSGRIDFEHPLKWMDFSYGGKITVTETDNDFKFFDLSGGSPLLDVNRSNTFIFKEQTEAVYLSGNKKMGKKEEWEMQAGLRMENTRTNGFSKTINQTNKINYVEFFPTAYLQYKPNETHTFLVDYGRRIMRPGFRNLNPFRYYSNAYNYTTGNPFLLPQFSNNIELKHSFKDFLFTSLSFTNETQGIGQVPFIDTATSIQFFTTLNYFTYNSIGISENFIYNKIAWWESNNQLDFFYAKSTFSNVVKLRPTNTLGFYFSSTNTFTLHKSKGIKAGVNFWYSAPENDLIQRKRSSASLDVSFRFTLLKKSLQVAVTAQDILKTNKPFHTTYTNDVKQAYSSYNDNRFFRISAAYRFGSTKLNVKKGNFGNEDEKGRSN